MYLILAKFRYDWVKIVDFLIKGHFWSSPHKPLSQCIYLFRETVVFMLILIYPWRDFFAYFLPILIMEKVHLHMYFRAFQVQIQLCRVQ